MISLNHNLFYHMKKVLIVEDEMSLLKSLASGFDRAEIEVLTAQDGEVGLQVALQNHPHLILLDLLMPKMDGITMLQKLRQDSWGKNEKVIILTNLDDQKKAAEAEQYGVSDYFIKSNWNLKDVIKKVRAELKGID